MQCTYSRLTGLAFVGFMLAASAAHAAGDPEKGARAWRACAACHTLVPGRHVTGPSLAGIWGRKAGTVKGFTRYSPALKSADIVWDDKTMDAWLADPRALIPGNRMTFRGIRNARVRADLGAFLKTAAAGKLAQRGRTGGAMTRGPELRDLKKVESGRQVTSVRYCADTYHVTTADGKTLPFWEFNLRFKSDSSDKGPTKGRPVLLRASMQGDRAFVIFADPAEISAFIRKKC